MQPGSQLHPPFSSSLQASLRGTPWAAPHYWRMALATPWSWAAPGGRGMVPWVAPRPTGSCRLTRLSPARAARRARAAPSPLPPRSLSRHRKVSAHLSLEGPPKPASSRQDPGTSSSVFTGLLGTSLGPRPGPLDLNLWVGQEPGSNKPFRESDARLKSENFAKVVG